MKKGVLILFVGLLLSLVAFSCKSLRGCDCPKFGEKEVIENNAKTSKV